MATKPSSIGIRRDQLLQWTEEGLCSVQAEATGIEGVNERIQSQRESLNLLIQKYCPLHSQQCADLSVLQRQLDGLFSLHESDATSRDEYKIFRRLHLEYKRIARRVSDVFTQQATAATSHQSTIEKRKPHTFPTERFDEIWGNVVRAQADRLPVPQDILSKLHLNHDDEELMAIYKFSFAMKTLEECMQNLALDLPKPHIDSWLYLRHIRKNLEAAFNTMDLLLRDYDPAFAQAYRQVYIGALAAIEQEVKRHYELRQEDEFATPLVWRGTLVQASNECNERYCQLELDLQQKVDAFFQTPEGNVLENLQRDFLERQRNLYFELPPRICREEYVVFERRLQEVTSAMEQSFRHMLPPSMHDVQNAAIEIMRRAIIASRQEAERLFKEAEQHVQNRNKVRVPTLGEQHEIAPPIESAQPIMGREMLVALCVRLRDEKRMRGDDDRQFTQFLAKYPAYAQKYWEASGEFSVAQNLLIQQLPPIIDLNAFRDFTHRIRSAFAPLEQQMLIGRKYGPMQQMREIYLEGMDQLEREAGEIFTMQLPTDTEDLPPATSSSERSVQAEHTADVSTSLPEKRTSAESSRSITRDDLWEKLQNANARADQICAATMEKYGVHLKRDTGDFEQNLHDAVWRLCPESITQASDLEKISCWLIGRIQAMNKVMPGCSIDEEDWSREINCRQFAGVLQWAYQPFPESHAIALSALVSKPVEIPWDQTDAEIYEMTAEDLLHDIMGNLRRAEERTIGSVGRRTKLDTRQKYLRQYFACLREALEQFVQNFCPATISSKGPLVAIDSFMSELSFSVRYWLEKAGCNTEGAYMKVRDRVNEAFLVPLEWSEMLLHSSTTNVDIFLDVDVGKIRPEDGGAAQDHSPPQSQTLSGNPSPAFAAALAASSSVTADYLWKQVHDIARAAERILPATLELSPDEREDLLRMIWRFRELGFELIDQVTSEGPVCTVEAYERMFEVLGAFIDKLQEKCHGKLSAFLADRFREVRREIEQRVCHEHAQQEMQQAVTGLTDAPKTASQYADFFQRYAHFLLADRCRQFLFSCVFPSMEKEAIAEIGSAIDITADMLAMELSERIEALLRQNRGSITLEEFQQYLARFVADVDITRDTALPQGSQERFRKYVLDFLSQEVKAFSRPQELLAAFPPASPSEKLGSYVEQETRALLQVREETELFNLRQQAQSDYQSARRYLRMMDELMPAMQEGALLTQLTSTVQGLGSLYAEYFLEKNASDPFMLTISPHIRPLVTILASLFQKVNAQGHPDQQRSAVRALRHFADTLQALIADLSQSL